MSKTLLFHDTFLMKGGAERLNIEIAKILDADIATAIWSRDCYDARSMGFQGNIIEVHPEFKRGLIGFLRMKWSFFRSRELLQDYDRVLFSNEAITGIWGIKKGTKTYYYAHSISRHLFDQKKQYLEKIAPAIRPLFHIFSIFLRWMYRGEISRVDTIFVNSRANQQNIAKLLGRDDSVILYPSVDTDKFNIFSENDILQILAIEGLSLNIKEYCISFSRLTHAKRIDSIIRAFQKMPDKKVVILYGKNDSQKDEFIQLGEGYPNVIFHSLTNNNHLPHIINGAIASICISRDEDFGMVAIESMSCGIPVIAVDEGGYRESVTDNETGYLLSPIDLENNLIDTVKNTQIDAYTAMQAACRKRAEMFSISRMRSILEEHIQ